MDTYIVRFYRRARQPSEDIVGTVEHVGSGRRAGFTGERELIDRLFAADDPPSGEAPPGAMPPGSR